MNDQTMIPNPSQPNVYGPITAGQMFERTFRLLRENFKLFFGIVLILVGVHIVAMGVMVEGVTRATGHRDVERY
jgi:hypothetical protein